MGILEDALEAIRPDAFKRSVKMEVWSCLADGEFTEGADRASLIKQIVDKHADLDYEFKAPTITDLSVCDHTGGYYVSPEEKVKFIAQVEIDLEQAREDYDNNDPMEHRTYPL